MEDGDVLLLGGQQLGDHAVRPLDLGRPLSVMRRGRWIGVYLNSALDNVFYMPVCIQSIVTTDSSEQDLVIMFIVRVNFEVLPPFLEVTMD